MTRDTLVGYLISAAMGSAVGLAIVVTTAVVGMRAMKRGAQAYLDASVRGSIWRMAGALVGVAGGLLLDPPSIATFAVSFLMVYLTGNAMLVLRFGRQLDRKDDGGRS
jgi:uncharacterized membrane protein YfcA